MSEKKLTLKLISDITARINSSDDLKSLLPAIIQTTKNVLDTEGCSLLLYDKESDCLVFDTTAGDKKEEIENLKVPRGKGIAGMVLETLKPEIVNDAKNDPRIYKSIDEKTGFQTRNLICVPMVANGEVQGVLEAVNSSDYRDFTDKDVRILQYLSDLAAIAIRNRRLIDALEARANELNCLYQISQSLSNVDEISSFLEQSAKSIANVLKFSKIAILFFNQINGKTYNYSTNIGFPMEITNNLIGNSKANQSLLKVIDSIKTIGQSIALTTKSSDVALELSNQGYFKTNLVAIPMIRNKEYIGALLAADKWDSSHFDDIEIRILTTASNQIAEAFNTLQMKEQSEKLKSIQRDLQIASQIQINSLPHIPETYNQLELAAYYKASKDIGGDFYDMIVHSPDEISLVIGDVSGKGVPAALFMEFSKTILNGIAARTTSPRQALLDTNQVILEKSGFLLFVTVMLIRVNTKDKTLTYASAGHNRQFLYKKSINKIQLLNGKGIPLGISNADILEYSLNYEPGDFLVLYTDGVTELSNEKGDLFQEDRLIQVIQNINSDKAKDILNGILRSSVEFQGNAEQHDDYTLFVIRLA